MSWSDILKLVVASLPVLGYLTILLQAQHKVILAKFDIIDARFDTLEADLKKHVTDTMLHHIRTENHT